ncbi:atp-dependent dna helicase [Holotrichia oblita]|uniref:Atp-dependent dna helicase n=1 Tax=Holotrichia oblita TaxID=644536 RepID=A0ACB9SKP7_HOLOL|nr:atp-dependent dna helicase [Holotrichia oblita]
MWGTNRKFCELTSPLMVKHLQRPNIKPVDVWLIIQKDGSISTAHCTCMAGHSEVCSHVGPRLFAVEYASKIKDARSCTDIEAAWPKPSMMGVPVREMDFGKTFFQEEKEIPGLTNAEIGNMLTKIERLGHNSVLMRIVEPFATTIADMANNIMPSVFDIFNENNLSKDYWELMAISRSINICLKDVSVIEQSTRNQSQNPNWFKQRAGRITASKFKAVSKTNKNSPSLSLIKSICYPTKFCLVQKLLHEVYYMK